MRNFTKLTGMTLAGATTLAIVGCGNVYLDQPDPSEGGTSGKDSGVRTNPDSGDARSRSNDGGLPPLPDSSLGDETASEDALSDADSPDTSEASVPEAGKPTFDAEPPFDVDVPESPPAWAGGSPVAFAVGQAPTSLFIDSTNLYWENSGTAATAPEIEYCPWTGCVAGPPTVITGADDFGFNSFSVSQGLLYSFGSESDSPFLFSCSVAGCPPASLTQTLTLGGEFPPIFTDSANAYFAYGTGIGYCPLGKACGWTPPMLYTGAKGDEAALLALSSTEAFFTAYSASGSSVSVMAAPLSGGAARTVSTAGVSSNTVAVTSDYLYYTDITPTGAIYRIPTAGGDPVIYAIDDAPYGLAADGTNLYWTNAIVTSGSVRACPLGSECTAPVTVASGQDNPGPIVVNSSTVFWGTASSISSAAKP